MAGSVVVLISILGHPIMAIRPFHKVYHVTSDMWYNYKMVSSQNKLDTVAQIETYNFDDVNENGILDEDEIGSRLKLSSVKRI